ARRGGRDLALTRREFELLQLFVRHPGEVLDRRRLHEEIWRYTFDPGTNVTDVFVGYVRRKLEAPGEPRVLHTVRGVGFVLRACAVRGLRGRLTLGVTTVLAAVLVVAGVVVARDVDHSERQVLDDRLRRTAELSRATAVAAVQEELPGADRRLDAVLSATSSSLRLAIGDTVLLSSGDPPPRRARL